MTNNLPEWEGDGPFQEYSSAVQAVCDWCGPTDFARALIDPNPGKDLAELVTLALGGPRDDLLEMARAASPISYANPSNPPHLIVHGTQDPYVAPWHATDLYNALLKEGVDVTLHMVEGLEHDLNTPEIATIVDQFFNCTLKPS